MLMMSCVTQRNIEYIQDKSKEIKSFEEAHIDDYKLKPNDELYIKISSLDNVTADIFSGVANQQSAYMSTISPYGASLIAYTVDKDGFLQIPVVGILYVNDRTLSEVSDSIKESLINVLNQPVVTVKLVNRYVSVLGEVRSPGHFAYSQEKLTILDAIGLAGDITDFGNRRQVLLTRNENGNNIRINVDLTQSEILSSNYYYLRPNDIVYVKPLGKKFWNLSQFPYSVILSTITTAVLLFNVIK
jgi:polysaccharide export outer membrane protein